MVALRIGCPECSFSFLGTSLMPAESRCRNDTNATYKLMADLTKTNMVERQNGKQSPLARLACG